MPDFIQDEFYRHCRKGCVEELRALFDRYPGKLWCLNYSLGIACEHGHLPIIYFLIEKGVTNWNWGLHGACRGGHLPVIHLMIKKGAKHWNWGLEGACRGGQLPTALLMIEKGATEFEWFHYLYGVESVKLYWFYRELTNPQARETLLRRQDQLNEVIQEFQTVKGLLVKQAKLPKELIRLIFTFL